MISYFSSDLFNKPLCVWEINRTFSNNFVSKHYSEPLNNINWAVVYRNAPQHTASSREAETVNNGKTLWVSTEH